MVVSTRGCRKITQPGNSEGVADSAPTQYCGRGVAFFAGDQLDKGAEFVEEEQLLPEILKDALRGRKRAKCCAGELVLVEEESTTDRSEAWKRIWHRIGGEVPFFRSGES